MQIRCLYAGVLSCILLMFVPSLSSAQLKLIEQGRSPYRIVIPADAPSSLRQAAEEMLYMFQKSSGVQLEIYNDQGKADIKKPIISLGHTRQAKQAGITLEGLEYDGYRIHTRGKDLFILGKDTPDKQWTPGGGSSNGTANGVYSFLETHLDARWLMPGELGKTVARHRTLTLGAIDTTVNPLFISRRLPYLDHSWTMKNTSPGVLRWQEAQKLGYSVYVWHSHNWENTVPKELYKQHPDWFAMIDGKRPAPGFRYKLETTNPELVRYFADQAISSLKGYTRPQTFSLSPSDSKGWSESPASKALYDPARPGERYPRMSSLVLKFYHDVAEIVESKYPEGKLAGYLYDSYLYPPTKVDMKLPDNFIPVIAPSSITYGFRLYHDQNKQDWNHVMRSWAKVAPENWIYYDIPNAFNLWRITIDYDRLSGATGMVTPPAPELLNFIFSGLVENKIRGGYLFGTPTWSNTAIANYMLAKLMWNPNLDAYALQRDWLRHAYGKAAGEKMESFYLRLEAIFRDYSKDKIIKSRPNDAMFQALYGDHYAELDALFNAASMQEMTPDQRKRLNLIGGNLAVVQWRLKNAGFLPEDFHSALTRSTSEISAILNRKSPGFEHFPEALIGWRKRDVENLPEITATIGKQAAGEGRTPAALQDKNLLVVYADQDREVVLRTRAVEHAALFSSCVIVEGNGNPVYSGLLDTEKPIRFKAGKGKIYYIYFPARPGTSFELDIHAGLSRGSWKEDKHLVLQARPGPVYVYMPYQEEDAIIQAREIEAGYTRIKKVNILEKTERLDPQERKNR